MPPKRRKLDKPANDAPAPLPPAREGMIDGPFACGECQRIRVEQKGGWLSWKCRQCGLPAWFRTRKERLEYAERSATYCAKSKSDPCNCAVRQPGVDADADEGPFSADTDDDPAPLY